MTARRNPLSISVTLASLCMRLVFLASCCSPPLYYHHRVRKRPAQALPATPIRIGSAMCRLVTVGRSLRPQAAFQ